MVFTFLENPLNLGIFFFFFSFPTQNSKQNLLKIYFLEQEKGVEKTMICFIKIQSENIKMAWNIRLSSTISI